VARSTAAPVAFSQVVAAERLERIATAHEAAAAHLRTVGDGPEALLSDQRAARARQRAEAIRQGLIDQGKPPQ